MKRVILYGTIAVIATIIVTANAQNTNNGYQFPSASQSYPGNDPQRTTGANNVYYDKNSRGNWVQPVPNPYGDFLRNWQYNQNYNTPAKPTVTWTDDNRRLGKEVPENRGEILSNTPIVQIESRLASQDNEVARQTLLDRAGSGRLAVIPLQKGEGVARFANTKPDVAVTSSPDSIVFRDRQREEAPVSGVVGNNVSIALTGFGLTTMKLLNAEPTRNPSISPYSIAQLLGLLQQGAAGNSQLEITQALLMTPSNTKEAFRALLNSIKSRSSRNVLKTATNIFVNNVFDLDRTFKNTAVRTFDSDVTPTNFNDAPNAARQINSWIAEKTQNYIRELISADMLEGDTQLVLANAVFFKGIWQSRFDPKNTTSGDFLLSDGNVKRVQYMRARLGLPVGLDRQTGIRYAVMPFEGEQYKMMFLIPEGDDLKTAINQLTTEKLLNFLSVTIKDVRAAIPKFTVQSDMDLKTVLNKMGIREIFGSQSNLYNVGTYRTISPQVTSALHKAVVSIDEQGGTAAAVTVFPAVALSFEDSTIAFNLNRPFLMILWDAENRVPLFMSRVDDPSM